MTLGIMLPYVYFAADPSCQLLGAGFDVPRHPRVELYFKHIEDDEADYKIIYDEV